MSEVSRRDLQQLERLERVAQLARELILPYELTTLAAPAWRRSARRSPTRSARCPRASATREQRAGLCGALLLRGL
jgi:hypothetical protein